MPLPEKPPPLDEKGFMKVVRKFGGPERLVIPEALDTKDYLHWDEMKHRKPPEDLTHEEWWLALKWLRQGLLKEVPLRDSQNRPFRFGLPDNAQVGRSWAMPYGILVTPIPSRRTAAVMMWSTRPRGPISWTLKRRGFSAPSEQERHSCSVPRRTWKRDSFTESRAGRHEDDGGGTPRR